jgi:hypothetical protein
MLSQQRINAVYSEVGFYKDDKQHTNFCDLLNFMQKNEFQFYCIYDLDTLIYVDYVDHSLYPSYPWSNALFIKNSFVRAKYSAWHYNWLLKIGRLPAGARPDFCAIRDQRPGVLHVKGRPDRLPWWKRLLLRGPTPR